MEEFGKTPGTRLGKPNPRVHSGVGARHEAARISPPVPDVLYAPGASGLTPPRRPGKVGTDTSRPDDPEEPP
jgi:hypothetical protein